MARLTRRALLQGGALALGAPGLVNARSIPAHWDAIVIGAGVFGAWTAERLREAGKRVLLVDAWAPAHARASSGGESRMTRSAYGADEIYARMAAESLADWRRLSDAEQVPLFHRTGVLFLFAREEPYLVESLRVHRALGLPTELLDRSTLGRRFPQIDLEGITLGLHEPNFGALMARRAVQALVARFVEAGGAYRQAAIAPPRAEGERLAYIRSSAGEVLAAEHYVFACGPWLGRLFPGLLGSRIFPTRQEVFFFAPPPGDRRFQPDSLPGWADFNEGNIYYGFPDLEGRGFKIAHDAHGPRMDPDSGDRTPSPSALADVRRFMARRFPALAEQPLSEARVCQYENSSNGDLLIDRHPAWDNVLLVGAGSGHGFKHAPAVGRYAAALLDGRLAQREPRFSLASKAEAESRQVH